MDTFLLFSILVLISIIVVLMLTLVDQMREVKNAVAPEATQQAGASETQEGEDDPDAPADRDPAASPDSAFAGLSGKRLWDLMTGKPLPDLDPQKAIELRPRYQVILTKHIEELFGEGQGHAQSGGGSKPAANRRTISGLRGSVVSWMPQPQADAIYKAGFDAGMQPPAQAASVIRANLAEACNALFSRTGLDPNGQAVAKKLVPTSGEESPLDNLSAEELAMLGEPNAAPALEAPANKANTSTKAAA
jgi:hypothetical protein